jgi:hypothetical protein
MLRLLRWPAILMASALILGTCLAQTPPAPPLQKLRIVGGLAGLNQYTRTKSHSGPRPWPA